MSDTVPADVEKVQLDEVLEKLGAFGRHQLLTLAMLGLVYATNSMYNVNYVFAVEDHGYRCKIPSCDSATPKFSTPWLKTASPDVPTDDDTVKQCSHYRPSEDIDGQCHFDNNTVLACTEYVYEIPNSFIAEFGLACEDWKQAMVGTAHAFGNMLGLLVQGQISDRWGRKTAAVFAGSMGSILGLTKSFANSFWPYVVLEALEAAVGDALSPIFMLSIEIVEKKRAVLFQMILLNCYTGGLIVMPLIAWAVPYWRHFLRVLYAPTLLILLYSFFLDESIRWLFSKGKRERAIKLIQKVAKRNGVELDKALLNKLDYIGEDDSNVLNDRKLLLNTFKSRIMMQRFLVCLVWWFTITLINYGMMIGSVFIDGNKYINFALLMMCDIPSNVFYWLALSKYKRKVPLVCSFILGGIFCVLQPFTPKGYAWLGLALFMAFETLATFSYNIVYMYTSELFPTYTRNSMHAVCSAMGRVGSLIAPQTPLLMSVWRGFPALLFGVTSLVCGALALLMPETAHCALPDTVAEAECIGRRRKRSSIKELASLTARDSIRELALLNSDANIPEDHEKELTPFKANVLNSPENNTLSNHIKEPTLFKANDAKDPEDCAVTNNMKELTPFKTKDEKGYENHPVTSPLNELTLLPANDSSSPEDHLLSDDDRNKARVGKQTSNHEHEG